MPEHLTTLRAVAEKRARVSYTLNRAQLAAAVLNARALRAASAADRKNDELERLRSELIALDGELVKQRPDIRPNRIHPVNSWAGRYGPRGSLKNSIVEHLRESRGSWIATDLIIKVVVARFGLTFNTVAERTAWYYSFKSSIRKLARDGFIERDQAPIGSGLRSKWRIAQLKPLTLDQIRAESCV